jgi:anti-sigma factor ChrR (cupin superfamily)
MPFEPEEMVINTHEMPWMPMSEGGCGKILRVCHETGQWTILFKQDAGSCTPPHRHLAAADFYVIEGCIEYRGGVARAGHFAREPMGAIHEKTTFTEDTIYLFTSYGALAMFGPDGSIAGIMDAQTLQGMIDAQANAEQP